MTYYEELCLEKCHNFVIDLVFYLCVIYSASAKILKLVSGGRGEEAEGYLFF
jgi:hypothetical protein